MNTIEDRLRDAFRADAETVRPEAIRAAPGMPASDRGFRQRPAAAAARRRWAVAALAAAAVVIVALGAAIAGPLTRHGGKSAPASITMTQGYAGGRMPSTAMPKFIVEIRLGHSSLTTRGDGTTLDVVSSADGRIIGHLEPPRPGYYFQDVAALGGNRTFVTAAVKHGVCESYLYRFRLTAAGQPTGLTPLPAGQVAGQVHSYSPGSLAGSADGSTVAYSAEACTHTRYSVRHDLGQVGVINLRSGTARRWTYIYPAGPFNLSLSADGALLGMLSNPSNGRDQQFVGMYDFWTLDTRAPGGQLGRYYHLAIRKPGGSSQLNAGLLSPNGRVSFAIRSVYRRGPGWELTLLAYDSATGQPIRTVRVLQRGAGVDEGSIRLGADTSGRYALYVDYDFVKMIDLATGRQSVVPGTPPRLADAAW